MNWLIFFDGFVLGLVAALYVVIFGWAYMKGNQTSIPVSDTTKDFRGVCLNGVWYISEREKKQ